MSGAQAKTAKVSIAGMKTMIGGRLNSLLSAALGCSTSFWISLIASATGCSRPNGPTRFGPRRTWMRPMIRRSSQTLISAAEADEGQDRGRAEDRGYGIRDAVRRVARDPVVKVAERVGQAAKVIPGVEEERHQRSISPTLMSRLPSVTIASAIERPTTMSLRTLRLMNEGERTCQRYGVGAPSLTR